MLCLQGMLRTCLEACSFTGETKHGQKRARPDTACVTPAQGCHGRTIHQGDDGQGLVERSSTD